MKINVVKVIDAAKPEEKGFSRAEIQKVWRSANLYEIEKKEVLQIVYKGKHQRYLVRR